MVERKVEIPAARFDERTFELGQSGLELSIFS